MVWNVEIIQKELDKAVKENSEIKFFFIFNQAVNEIKIKKGDCWSTDKILD